jgi:hypothetical protein
VVLGLAVWALRNSDTLNANMAKNKYGQTYTYRL